MHIQTVLFKILTNHPHHWVRYWRSEKVEGTTMPGEYIEMIGSFFSGTLINDLFDLGYQIDTIQTQQINADIYSKILFRRKIDQ